MDTLKIGLSSTTTVTVPSPNGGAGVKRELQTLIDSYRDIHNNLIIHITGNNKKSFSLEFENKTKTDYETLEAYCNTPVFYYVEITNGTRDIINGYYYLTINNISQTAITQDFLYNFSIDFKEK